MPSTFFLIDLCFYYYYCLLSKRLLIFLSTFPMLSMKVFYLHHFILLHYHCNLRKKSDPFKVQQVPGIFNQERIDIIQFSAVQVTLTFHFHVDQTQSPWMTSEI